MTVDQLQNDLKEAQKAKDELKVSTLRLLLSELSYAKINTQKELSEAEILAVISKELKKRREAVVSFRTGNREELAEKEEAEAKILEAYLPAQMSDEELTKIVEEAITEVGATSVAQMGRVMSAVMGKVAGKAEGSRVSSLVKQKLSAS